MDEGLLEFGGIPCDRGDDRAWILVIFERELPAETVSTNVSSAGTKTQKLFICS